MKNKISLEETCLSLVGIIGQKAIFSDVSKFICLYIIEVDPLYIIEVDSKLATSVSKGVSKLVEQRYFSKSKVKFTLNSTHPEEFCE